MSREGFLAGPGGSVGPKVGKEGAVGGTSVVNLPVAGDELTAALIAVEAFQVKHRVAGPHHQFVRGYLVAATPADAAVAEQSATRRKKWPIKTRVKSQGKPRHLIMASIFFPSAVLARRASFNSGAPCRARRPHILR